MKSKELRAIGIPKGESLQLCHRILKNLHEDQETVQQIIESLSEDPVKFLSDEIWKELAQLIIETRAKEPQKREYTPKASYKVWGNEIEQGALDQMKNASKLPVATKGALMPDAHLGYGLPIGGVLATENAVIPYAVGMDIACRMKMTVLDIPPVELQKNMNRFKEALFKETAFGMNAHLPRKKQHKVMDYNWNVSAITRDKKNRAWEQLGSSGSGNHFVEFGILTVERDDFELPVGEYLALLSHSGSRNVGGAVAQYYSKLAQQIHPELPKDLEHLAWLSMNSDEGEEYWAAMELMGKYAAANHELIHTDIARHLGALQIYDLENHHNFAWKEEHDGKNVIVHRKGATPAGRGVMGIIPGSMATAGYIVRGKGNLDSLNSASHGAGRKMSRNAAKKKYTMVDVENFLAHKGVTLLSAGVDEAPMAYKDIEEVMDFQADLVEKMARFDPKLVRMAQAGEKPED